MSSSQEQEKLLLSGPNNSVSSVGTFDSESNQNLNGVIKCEESDSFMSDTSDSVVRDFQCPDCLKFFQSKYNLKRHANKYHSKNTALIESLKSNRSLNYKCENCHLKFSDPKNLKAHQNKIHSSQINKIVNYVCSLCQDNFEKQEIIFHFKNVHGIDMDDIELEFNSVNDFLAWKVEIENNTKSKFVSYSSKHINVHGVKSYNFRCHRSGNFISQSKGVRHLKKLGSNKINAYCPAALKVREHADGKCAVSYQKVHIGHQNDLDHLFLTVDERKNIASKIAVKIPMDNILDEIKNSVSDAGVERVHLLTKKDLHNIGKSFNLSCNSTKRKNNSDHLVSSAKKRGNITSKKVAKNPLDNILDEIINSISDAGLDTTTINDESQRIIGNGNDLILNETARNKSQSLSFEQRKEELKRKGLELIDSFKSVRECVMFDRMLKSASLELKMLKAQKKRKLPQ